MRLILFVLLLVNSSLAYATINNTVNDIIIHAEAASSAIAKNHALEDGKRRGLQLLLMQFDSDQDEAILEQVSDELVNKLVQGFELHQEKVTPNSYQAILNITFNMDFLYKNFPQLYKIYAKTIAKEKSSPEQSITKLNCYIIIKSLEDFVYKRTILQRELKGLNSLIPTSINNEMVRLELNFAGSLKELAKAMRVGNIGFAETEAGLKLIVE